MRRPRLRAALGGALVVFTVALACTTVPTDPNAVLSLQLNPPQLPSMVVLDSLHDTLGNVVPLVATAFNNQGESIPGAPIRFLVLTGRENVSADSVTGKLFATDTGSARVLAFISGIQTLPVTIPVVLHPDSFYPLDSAVRTLDYNKANGRDTTMPLPVVLSHIDGIDTTGITPYRLQYVITYPLANTNLSPTRAQIVNTALVPQLIDTTVGGGLSTLQLKLTLLADTVTDTMGVSVFAYQQDHTAVPGSPVHFTIALHIH
jgi:hypothetical protein